jgi:hypothetical protein
MSASILTPMFRRPLPPHPVAADRLTREFALIDKNNFTLVFLQVQRIIELCKELTIPHIIRGSGGCSLVCFLLGISHTDPLTYNMELARFMNHGRTDMPDIDIDIPYNRRDELYSHIGTEWPGMVARISNHVLFKYKSALREAIRELAPTATYRKGAALEEMVRDPEQAALVRARVAELTGTLRTESLHCGGIVIFSKERSVPPELLLKTTGILPQISLNKDETEDAGFIKIDILSNRGMAQWWEAAAPERRELLSYPATDAAVHHLFRIGDTIGLTFGESRGMRHIFQQILPTCVEDVAIALALIRPAAAAGGRKARYLEALRAGALASASPVTAPIVYDDDALSRIRAVLTLNNIGYDTDVLDSLADQFRKAFAKQRTGDCLRFRSLCRSQGLPESLIRQIIDDLNQLQHYSFCKSHALSYAQLVWALAYEKAHNPHRFWVAALNHCHSEYRRWVHWREARCSGLRLTRGSPPYHLAHTKDGAPYVAPHKGEQRLLISDDDPRQILTDMKERGYWLGERFFPGCYYRSEVAAQRKLNVVGGVLSGSTCEERTIYFRGLIATGRVVYSEVDDEESATTDAGAGTVTLICIGYDNKKYLDLVIPGAKGHLLQYAAIEGRATVIAPYDTLKIVSVCGVSLKSIISKMP